jgi:hypothetical protein
MPGALTGDGDDQGYMFTVKTNPDEIQRYYESELAKQGWSVMAIGNGSAKTTLIIFIRDTESMSVSIFDAQADEGVFLVMLVK